MRRILALVSIAVSVGCGGQVKSSSDQGSVEGNTTTTSGSTPGETMTSGGPATTEGSGTGTTMVAPTGMGGGGGTSQAGGTGGGSAGGIIVHPPAQDVMPSCPTHNPLNNQVFASIDEKRHALVGRWTQCGKQGIGGAESVGIEITSDGLFSVLVRDATGAVVPGKGGLLEGYVDVSLNDVAFVAGNVHMLTSMQFSEEIPYRMYAWNTDFIGYDYIRQP